MIPKVIHYCWLSEDKYPDKIRRCIDSWKRNLPDYELIKWDFSRIDKSKFKWVSDAFDNRRYAYAADYIRVYALYHYGGIYLDSDVEILKPFDDLLDSPYFMSHEYQSDKIEAAVMGAEKGLPLFKHMLDYYDGQSFILSNGSFNEVTIPTLMMNVIKNQFEMVEIDNVSQINQDYANRYYILPYEYFSPKSYLNGHLHLTDRTYSIHHFSGSWYPKYYQVENAFWHSLGLRNLKILWRIKNLLKYGTLRSNPTKSI